MPVPLPSAESLGLPRVPEVRTTLPSYQGGIAARAGEAIGGAETRLGETGEQSAVELSNIADQQAFAEGMQQFQTQNLNLRQQALQDPDYATAPQRYGQMLQSAADTAASGIRSPQMRAMFQSRVNWMVNGTQDEILQRSYQRGIQEKQGWLLNYLDGAQQQFGAVGANLTPAQITLLGGAKQTIDSMAIGGVLTPAQAQARWNAFRTQTLYTGSRLMIARDPGAFTTAATGVAPGSGNFAGGSIPPDLDAGIAAAAAKYGSQLPGLDLRGYLRRTSQIEGGGALAPPTSASRAAGPFGFMPATAARYGLAIPSDPTAAPDAAARLTIDNAGVLRAALGREPSPAELYLAHQQGAAGAAALLLHPDMPAAQALAAAGVAPAVAAQSIAGNGGIPAAPASRFTQMWQSRFGGAPQAAAAGPAGTIAKQGNWTDYLDPAHRVALLDEDQRALEMAQRRASEASLMAQRQQALAAKQAQETAVNTYVTSMLNGQTDGLLDKIANDPALDGPTKHRLYDWAAPGAQHDAQTYGPGFYQAFQAIHAAPGDPEKITDPAQLYSRVGPNGDLTLAGLKALTAEMQGSRTPEAAGEAQMRAQFFKVAHAELSMGDEGLGIKDPKGEALFLKYMGQTLPAIAAARAAGKTPAQIYTPGSPDYIGNNIEGFKRAAAQQTADALAAQKAAAAAQQYTSAPALAAALRAGKIDRPTFDALAIRNGWARPNPTTPPPQAPVYRGELAPSGIMQPGGALPLAGAPGG